MKRIDLDDLAYALENASWETDHYLDLETGQVIMVATDTCRELEDIHKEAYDLGSEERFDLARVLKQRDMPEWQKEA